MRVFVPVLLCIIVAVGTEAGVISWVKGLFGDRNDDLLEHKLPPLRIQEVTKGIICCISCRFADAENVNATQDVTTMESVTADAEDDCCDACLWGQLPEEKKKEDESEKSFVERLTKKLKDRFALLG